MHALPKVALAAIASAIVFVALGSQLRAGEDSAEGGSLPANFPPIARPELVSASLDALRGRGWNLSASALSRHSVLAADRVALELVVEWAAGTGFTPREPRIVFEHGGLERYWIDLVCACVLTPGEVHSQGLRIYDAVANIDGASYVDWVAERVQ